MLHGAVDREYRELMHAADFGADRARCQRVADFPTRRVKRLAKRADDDAARRELGVSR